MVVVIKKTFQKKKGKSIKKKKKRICVPATILSPSNFTKIKTPSQVASKNVARVLVASKIFDKLLGNKCLKSLSQV